MRKTITIVLVIAVALGGLFLAMKKRAPKAPPPTTQQIWAEAGIPVETAAVFRGNIEQMVEVTGDISALEKVTLSAKVTGRVARIGAREGDFISRGAAVIVLDQEDALSGIQEAEGALAAALARLSQAKTNAKVTKTQTDSAIEQAAAALAAAEAQLAVVKKPARTQERMVAENRVASAKANLENAETNYKRHQKLLKEGAISAATHDTAETQYKVAKADYNSALEQLSLIKEGGRSEDISAAQSQVNMAKQQLRQAKANASQNLLRQEDIKSAQAAVQQAKAALSLAQQRLSYTYIKSPISGQLASRLTEPGQVVSPGQALGEVVDLGSLFFKGEVSETELPSIKKGQKVQVRVDAIPGKLFTGVVDEIYPTGSTQSRNFPVRIRVVDADGSIRPGMFARGSIITGIDRDVLLVPKDAVFERRGTKVVFTIDAKNTAKRHDVSVVRENRDYAEIRLPTDLQVGDRVVIRGQQNLEDGKKVLVRGAKSARTGQTGI